MKFFFKPSVAVLQLWLVAMFSFCNFTTVSAQDDRGEETVTFDFGCPEIKYEVIGAITKDGIEFDKNRLTIGVAEKVELSINSMFQFSKNRTFLKNLKNNILIYNKISIFYFYKNYKKIIKF